MSDAIKAGTILIEEGTSMPETLMLKGGPFSSGWRSVSGLDRKELDRKINKAGWTFFFMAGEIKISTFGFDKEKAVRRAVKGVITNVEAQKCNCLEITQVSPRSFLGIPYVNVRAYARHIQKGGVFTPTLTAYALTERSGLTVGGQSLSDLAAVTHRRTTK